MIIQIIKSPVQTSLCKFNKTDIIIHMLLKKFIEFWKKQMIFKKKMIKIPTQSLLCLSNTKLIYSREPLQFKITYILINQIIIFIKTIYISKFIYISINISNLLNNESSLLRFSLWSHFPTIINFKT